MLLREGKPITLFSYSCVKYLSAVVVPTAGLRKNLLGSATDNILFIAGHTLWASCESDHRAAVGFKSCARQRSCVSMYVRLTSFVYHFS